MTTYSAFDPGMSHPLSVVAPIPPNTKPKPTVLQYSLATGVQGINMADLFSGAKAKSVVTQAKPWPYHLPAFLRPRDGSTYALKFGGNVEVGSSPKRVGILQAILYGVPDPDKTKSGQSVMKEGGVLHQVFYGVKDEQEKGVDAKVVEVENGGEEEDVVGAEAEEGSDVAQKRGKHVKADLEINSVGGYELIAK
jgi:hypothetical protein